MAQNKLREFQNGLANNIQNLFLKKILALWRGNHIDLIENWTELSRFVLLSHIMFETWFHVEGWAVSTFSVWRIEHIRIAESRLFIDVLAHRMFWRSHGAANLFYRTILLSKKWIRVWKSTCVYVDDAPIHTETFVCMRSINVQCPQNLIKFVTELINRSNAAKECQTFFIEIQSNDKHYSFIKRTDHLNSRTAVPTKDHLCFSYFDYLWPFDQNVPSWFRFRWNSNISNRLLINRCLFCVHEHFMSIIFKSNVKKFMITW